MQESVRQVAEDVKIVQETVNKAGQGIGPTVSVNAYAAAEQGAYHGTKRAIEEMLANESKRAKQARGKAAAGVKMPSPDGDAKPLTDLQQELLEKTLALFANPTPQGVRDLFNFVIEHHPCHKWLAGSRHI